MLRNLLFSIRMSFRMWVRNRSRPLTIEEAEEKKLFWSKIYMLCGCAAFVIITKSIINPSGDDFCKSLPVSKKIIDDMSNESQFRVIKFTGLTKTSDFLMSKEDAYEIRNSEIGISNNNSEEGNFPIT